MTAAGVGQTGPADVRGDEAVTKLQQEAKALGDPTRHAIFRAIVDAGTAVGVAELNEAFPLNHNAIRQHLAKLVEAGLVVESTAPPAGRGRPRLLFTADPAVAGRWGTEGPYQRLSELLVEVIKTGQGPEEVGRRAADRFRAPVPTGDAVADVSAAMARQGFEPELRSDATAAEVVLQACPFAEVAVTDRDTICALHLGIAEGLVDGSDVVVDQLIAYDPRRAGCRLRLQRAPSGEDPPELSLRGGPPPA